MTGVSIVIPAYNEAPRLPATLMRVIKYLKGQSGMPYEIIVVDDGSSDRTPDIVREYAKFHPEIRLVQNPHNMGKGASVRHGVMQASLPLVLFSDADLSTPIEELDKLRRAIEDEGFQMSIGSRALPGSELAVRQPPHRELMGRVFNLIVQAMLIPGIRDTQCGFKLFTREAAQDIFERSIIGGFGFDVEIVYLALHLNYRVKEVPVKWVNSPRSTVRVLEDPLRMFRDLFLVRSNWKKGLYERAGRKENKDITT